MLHCSIDLDANGVNIGYLKLIHSDDRYSCSTIPVPIISMKNGSGPTVLLTAGVHGDEYATKDITYLKVFEYLKTG